MSTRQQDMVDLESLFVTRDGAGIRLTGEQCSEIAKAIAAIRLSYATALSLLSAEITKNRRIMLELAGQATPGVIAIFPERRRTIEIEGDVIPVPISIETFASDPAGGAA